MRSFYCLVLILASLLASTSWAAISCTDAGAVKFNNATPADPETGAGNYTPPAIANRITFMGVGSRKGAGASTITPTLGGNSLTAVSTVQYTDPAGAGLYYIINLAASSQSIAADFDGAPLADAIIVWTCTGVDTTSPIRSFAAGTALSTTVSDTPASVQSGDMVVDFFFKDGNTDGTVGANQTVIKQGNDGSESAAGASWQDGANGAAMTWTIDSQQWAHFAVVLKPFSSPNAARPIAPMVLD